MKLPAQAALNAICPYYTMFPLEFPWRVLKRNACAGDYVLDPFSGRGTTNYASRLMDLPSIGIDSSPVAVALTQAKLANTSPEAIVRAAGAILERGQRVEPPAGDFWRLAYRPNVLRSLCQLRDGLLHDSRSASRQALRAIVLGALHGPMTKGEPSYLSNQSPRTYAPKPAYATKFWKARGLAAPEVDVLELIRRRAERYYRDQPVATGKALCGDSRNSDVFQTLGSDKVRWIITSPPYYGMRTYIPDQWLRNWFLGGPSHVDYSNDRQLGHSSPESFSAQLATVWRNVASVATPDARLVVRFGGISDRKADPLAIIKMSFHESPWRVVTARAAGTANEGRRQAVHFQIKTNPRAEYDVWAQLRG